MKRREMDLEFWKTMWNKVIVSFRSKLSLLISNPVGLPQAIGYPKIRLVDQFPLIDGHRVPSGNAKESIEAMSKSGNELCVQTEPRIYVCMYVCIGNATMYVNMKHQTIK